MEGLQLQNMQPQSQTKHLKYKGFSHAK